MITKNKLLKINIVILALITLFFRFPVMADDTYPIPTDYKYINDYVGILNESQTKNIIAIGKELEDKTGAQSVVVVINSTSGIPIDDYSNKLFRTWGIGESGKDNGLLMVVSIDDRQWRVEVGRGLEGAVPDALSSRVMNALGKPSFTAGNYGEGIVNSYSALCDYIGNEYGVTLDKSLNVTLPNETPTTTSRGGKIIGIILGISLLADLFFNRGRVSSTLLQILFWSSIGRGGRGPRGGSGFGGGGGGFGGFGGGSSNGGGSSGSW